MEEDLNSKFLGAAHNGYDNDVIVLIENGVDVNVKNGVGITALIATAHKGQI
jgi:ankyrin repeat protein